MKRPGTSGTGGRLATVAALVLIGLLWLRLLLVQPHVDETGGRIDPRQAQRAQRKLDEVSGEARRLAEAARRGESRATILFLSAEEINALLTAQPEVRGVLARSRIRDPEVRLRSGRVITTATIQTAGLPARVTADGQLEARSGMLLYASESVHVAGVPAPAPLRAAVDARIQEAFRRVQHEAHARVDRVTVGPNRITLYLSSRPGANQQGADEPRS